MQRQVVLDTETTGINVEEGHRVIEIGCVELIDRKPTGRNFHYYVNPEREIEKDAQVIHGITNEFLCDKPYFREICDEFLAFVQGCELIIHNAPFDLAFLDNELLLAQKNLKRIIDYCKVIDTLPLARTLHVGQRNNLDALCKRYHIDNTKREFHGALLDAHLLAHVYLAMTGGQGSFFDDLHEPDTINKTKDVKTTKLTEKFSLIVAKASAEEVLAHEQYLENMKQVGKCLWLEKLSAE